MSQFSARRVVTTAGLALGTAALGMALAPAALAAPAVTVSATTVAPGGTVTLSGADCVPVKGASPVAVVRPAVDPQWASTAKPGADGTWSYELTAPTEAGTYTFDVFCDQYYEKFDYADVTITVATPAAAPAPAPATAKPAGTPRGAAANTAGVASPDTGAATGDKAVPGAKVVKVLTGFKPFEVVTITLNSTPTNVGTFTADASGTVRAEFVIPAGSQAGDHTLVYEGNLGTYFQETFTVAPTALALASTSGDELAATGASVALPLGLGLGTLAAGGGLVFAARRRTAGATQA